RAQVGDDVFGEDPTVNRLQDMAARLLGKEAALFVTSGTQGNLVAILSHCDRGDEYIVGQTGHSYYYEGGGAAALGSVSPQPLWYADDGTLDLDMVERVIKPADHHHARTRLFCLENTQDGRALPMEYLAEAAAFADHRGLATHLDGARMFNAAVKHRVDPRDIAGHFDSVSFCLSKGLGAPVGSVLAGSAGFIDRAHRWRKALGGGLRQAGVLAAAGIYALEHHIDRLAEDHANAEALADGLAALGLDVDFHPAQTNMVFVNLPEGSDVPLADHLRAYDIVVTAENPIRLVTHLDIDGHDIDHVLEVTADFFA
ncbi:MAG: low-specificity L-threonine aldolase, partial [Acidimicrobiia bacterium]|nr:low-specificity L-threonine aldolase [Acidimicrobiia bacterium]